MSIPDFIRTKWKSKGAVAVQISDLTCKECQNEWCTFLEKKSKEHQRSVAKNCSIHSKYITCYLSTLDVWEYQFYPRWMKNTQNKGQYDLEESENEEVIESNLINKDDSGIEMLPNEYDDSDFTSDEPYDSRNEKYCEPWYAIFSPFWWLGCSLDEECALRMCIKKAAKESSNYFVNAFYPHVRKGFCAPMLSKNLHITKVEEIIDERSPIDNLIKIEMKINEGSRGPAKIYVHYMQEDDIDTELHKIFYEEPYPHSLEFNGLPRDIEDINPFDGDEDEEFNKTTLNSLKDEPDPSDLEELPLGASRITVTSYDECKKIYNGFLLIKKLGQLKEAYPDCYDEYKFATYYLDVTVNNNKNSKNLDGDLLNGRKAEKITKESNKDWFQDLKVSFDENGYQKLVPVAFNSEPLPVKIKQIVSSHYRLMRLSTVEREKISPDFLPPDFPDELTKYWVQRYRLFLKYNDGIKLNNEAWFSVTPEMIAAHQAYRCSCDIVVDAFCGAGSNAIQLALTCNHVIAIDTDSEVLEFARHNARVYGVEDKIEFIQGDFFQMASSLKADAVLLSPPWGGINYKKHVAYDVLTLDGSMNCKLLMNIARKISPNIALYIPKSSNLSQVIELAGVGGKVDIEFHYISMKNKSLTAYYGSLADFCE